MSVLLFLIPIESFGQTVDTVLIHDLKNFFFKETVYVLRGDFFTKRDYSGDFRIYVSPANRIDYPDEKKLYTRTINNDTLKENHRYDTLNYDVPADAACKIRPEFSSYNSAGLAFVIFHELMHNYLSQKHIRLPYTYEEAICDIMGNYCTLEFAKTDSRITKTSAKTQIAINNQLYAAINRCIGLIVDHPDMTAVAHLRCEKKLRQILNNANEFQRFRFGYKVNNGFLLKCRNYSWNYFIFQKIFLDQATIVDFIKILAHLSDDYPSMTMKEKRYCTELCSRTNWTLEVTFNWDSISPEMINRNDFNIAVTNSDPLNYFLNQLRSKCNESEITPDTCLYYWNHMLSIPWQRTDIENKKFLLTGNIDFGKNWFVTGAFVSDNTVLCWMEEIDLQMGKRSKIVLSKNNAVSFTVKTNNK